jgi:hypothetical protein
MIKPRSVDNNRLNEEPRSTLAHPINRHVASPLFEGWGPKL